MATGLAPWAALALGATAMYLLDPDRGRARRARLRDRTLSTARSVRGAALATGRDIAHRARGIAAEASLRHRREAVPDAVLVERVRAKAGRYVSNPAAIEVEARAGRLTLTGPVLAAERAGLVRAVQAVPGVQDVNDRLEVHASPGRVPALQSSGSRSGERSALRRPGSPATRAMTGGAGTALVAYGLSHPTPAGIVAGVVGAAALVNAMAGGRVLRRRLTQHP